MTPRARPGRAGFSNITSTVILTSVLLSIMIVASYLSNDVLTTQIAASEFKAAEDLVTSIDRAIHNLMFKPGSSTAIKVSFSTTAPGFTRTGKKMNITFSGKSPYSVDVNVFNIEGRQAIGGAIGYDLQGNSGLLISPYNGSFGRIYIWKPWNWRASLDYERVLYTFTGIVKLYDASISDYTRTNTFQITTIALDFKNFNVTKNSIILIENEKINTESITLNGNWGLTVSGRSGSETKYLNSMGGNSSYPTLVNIHKVYIKISVLGEG